ncbi:MAG: class I SAM-dependent methyltransferase, partial [Mycobacterium sp.]
SMEDFLHVFPDAGWEITYLWLTTYQVNVSVEAFEQMIERNPDKAEELKPVVERFRLMESWLTNGRAHAPFWEMHATRLD